jgi:succinyl-diaminopimelate desuccinylase
MSGSDTLELARQLIRRRSVTPEDAGCQTLLAERLGPLGFHCETLRFGDVTNLWARLGEGGPLLAFAGHTDVVPTGPETRWRHPPFDAVVEDGRLYGRGAADMKGSLAAFVTACERYLAAGHRPAGSLALLITSDEEGDAIDGTRRVVETLQERGERIDYCIVGEPSSSERVGDTVKIGRRGSLNGRLTVHGVQGHVAYPQHARNPVFELAPALAELAATRWDEGNDSFPPTSFQVSNIHAGTGATNVIPGSVDVLLNFRFSTETTAADLQRRVEAILERHGLSFALDWSLSGEPFLTESGALVAATRRAIGEETGLETTLSTAGGTSDGRFIAPTGTQVVELGPVNATIHQVDEHVSVGDLDTLSRLYERMIRALQG